MFNIKMTGLDEVEKALKDLQKAVESLEGEIGTLRIDPDDPQAAISEMERMVDAKLAPYSSNPMVKQVGDASKETFRTAILKEARDAKRKST